jgi:GntR family transcriptional regulator/MocR family aminotransferase
VLSVSRRLALISKAREAGAWLIEDDYDGDFRHSGAPIASMQGLNEDTPILYIGSYSKTLFPSLRLGFLVLPTGMMELAGPVLYNLLRNGQHLQQLALADFITTGEFGRHLGRMRRLYRERQRVLRHELSAWFDPKQILGGQSGMHLTLKLVCGTDDKLVADIARQKGLGVQALSTFCMKSTAANGLVIGYGNTSPQRIPSAVRLLVDVIKAVRQTDRG